MKKLIVLVAALLLVGTMAMADATVNGKVEYRTLADNTDEVFTNAGIIELKINGTIDDNTSVYIELEEGPKLTGYTFPGVFGLDKVHITVDAGAALDLPIGVTIRAGFDEYKVKDGIKVTKGEYEDWLGFATDDWGYQIELMPIADMDVTIRTQLTGDWDAEGMLIGAYGTIDPVTFEASYVVPGGWTEGGVIEAGAESTLEVGPGMLGVAAVLDYYLDAEADGYTDYDGDIEFAAGVDFAMEDGLVRAGAALRGNSDDALGGVAIYLSSAPPQAEGLEAFLSIGLAVADSFATDTTAEATPESGLDSVDFGLSYKIGGATFYAGYLYSTEGGKIAKEWAELDPSGEEGAIYLRASAEF
jgi:hypothetical protein